MNPSMEGMLEEVRRLPNEALLGTLKEAVRKERHITLRVLLLLIELDQRKLHLDQYSSLFAYCTDRLRYSNSAAGRRIAAARCLRDYPRVWPMLLDGRLNLTTLGIIARVISIENADELLDRAAWATQRQVEELAARFGGPRPARDRIKPVRTSRRPDQRTSSPSSSSSSVAAGTSAAGTPESSIGSVSGGNSAEMPQQNTPGTSAATPSSPDCEAGESRPASTSQSGSAKTSADGAAPDASDSGQTTDEPLMYDITFRADAAFVEKLRRVQALLSAGDPNPPLASIFHHALELTLDRHDPERREARRQVRHARKEARATGSVLKESEVLSRTTRQPEEATESRKQEMSPPHESKTAESCSDARRSKDVAGGSEGRRQVRASGNSSSGKSSTNSKTSDGRMSDNSSIDRRTSDRKTSDNSSIDSRTSDSRMSEERRPSGGPLHAPSRGVRWGQRRRIPQWVRDLVLLRDGKRCSYVGPEGRCPSFHGLEIEHAVPVAKGGSNDLGNLRAFCGAHNQRAAEIAFGVKFMRQRRERNTSRVETRTPAPEVTVPSAIHERQLDERTPQMVNRRGCPPPLRE